MSVRDRAALLYTTKYAEPPVHLVRIPGRVNLIGEHTDYNEGFVLPMTIDREMWIAFRPRSDQLVHVRSESFVDTVEIDLDQVAKTGGWGDYVQGTARALAGAGRTLRGWDGVVASDIPMGAGLSSSAALGIGSAVAFAVVSGFYLEPIELASTVQKSENEWVGVNCGIMDPLVMADGHHGHAQLIDCRTLETTDIPVPANAGVVVLDTGTRRGHTESAYNTRRAQCAVAARHFGVEALRDVTMDMLASPRGLDEVVMHRARHVVGENLRTLEAAEALRSGDVETVGRLMNESHASLRDNFEVSSRPLDAMAEAAQGAPGCFGARLMGGGFAGCAVALVEARRSDGFRRAVLEAYEELTGLEGHAWVTHPIDGVSTVLGTG